MSTTTTSTTTTTLGGGSVLCEVETAECIADACTCFGVTPGFDYHLGAGGQVSGPVGTQLRVNTQLMQGGDIECGVWTKIDASVNPSCDTIGCCERQNGEPETASWLVHQAIDYPCFCPERPYPLSHNFIAQCQLGTNPAVETQLDTGPCP